MSADSRVSVVALVDVARQTSYARSVEQTPPQTARPATEPAQKAKAATAPPRIDFYLQHLSETRLHWPRQLKYGVFAGAFAKHKFIAGVRALSLHASRRLRCAASLRFLYAGAQQGRGRRKRYDGKVNFQDLSRFAQGGEIAPASFLYPALVNSSALRRASRVVVVVNRTKPAKPRLRRLVCDRW